MTSRRPSRSFTPRASTSGGRSAGNGNRAVSTPIRQASGTRGARGNDSGNRAATPVQQDIDTPNTSNSDNDEAARGRSSSPEGETWNRLGSPTLRSANIIPTPFRASTLRNRESSEMRRIAAMPPSPTPKGKKANKRPAEGNSDNDIFADQKRPRVHNVAGVIIGWYGDEPDMPVKAKEEEDGTLTFTLMRPEAPRMGGHMQLQPLGGDEQIVPLDKVTLIPTLFESYLGDIQRLNIERKTKIIKVLLHSNNGEEEGMAANPENPRNDLPANSPDAVRGAELHVGFAAADNKVRVLASLTRSNMLKFYISRADAQRSKIPFRGNSIAYGLINFLDDFDQGAAPTTKVHIKESLVKINSGGNDNLNAADFEYIGSNVMHPEVIASPQVLGNRTEVCSGADLCHNQTCQAPACAAKRAFGLNVPKVREAPVVHSHCAGCKQKNAEVKAAQDEMKAFKIRLARQISEIRTTTDPEENPGEREEVLEKALKTLRDGVKELLNESIDFGNELDLYRRSNDDFRNQFVIQCIRIQNYRNLVARLKADAPVNNFAYMGPPGVRRNLNQVGHPVAPNNPNNPRDELLAINYVALENQTAYEFEARPAVRPQVPPMPSFLELDSGESRRARRTEDAATVLADLSPRVLVVDGKLHRENYIWQEIQHQLVVQDGRSEIQLRGVSYGRVIENGQEVLVFNRHHFDKVENKHFIKWTLRKPIDGPAYIPPAA